MPKKIIITDYQMDKIKTVKDYEMRESLIYLLRKLYSYSRIKNPFAFYQSKNIADEVVSIKYSLFTDYCKSYNSKVMKNVRYHNLEMPQSIYELNTKQIKLRLDKLENLGVIKLIAKNINQSNRPVLYYEIIKE